MTLTDYTVKGVRPDMPLGDFIAVLRGAGSPVGDGDALRVYAYATARGLSPAYLLAMFHHESTYGRFGSAATTHSWGNTRPPSFGAPQTGVSDRHFSIYANWVDGGVSTVARHFDHAPYFGKDTVRAIIPIWAPSTDGNNTERYIEAVLADIERWTGGTTVAVPKPAVDTGHPSPNRGYPTGTHRVDAVIWHITQGTNSLGWLTNPSSGASSNYLIARDGTIYELVPPTESAWANGRVCKPDVDHDQPLITQWLGEGVNFNQRTVSVEHEGWTSYGAGGSLTAAQVDATVRLTAWLCSRFGLPPDGQHIFGHYEIDSCDRPNCPGFSTREWATWRGQVAAILRGDTTEGEVKEPAEGEFKAYQNAKGETIFVANFGGVAVGTDGIAAVDLGVSVINATGQKYDRSIQNNVVQEWQGPR
jgi:N-acetyl-anhydromuramyl-L-alanine amidase AmpD